ncbi:MAG: hypothetical protein KBC15_00215 [Candidatus Levybacteria bacterium]|nr:hypothetical protein [Candidatus Levybacteria bacterium]
MRRKKRFLPFLVLSILSLVTLLILIFTTSPSAEVSLGPITLNYSLIILLPLLSLTFFLPSYVLKNKIHGILLSIFVAFSLLFRLQGLTHPIFFLLLLAILLTLELLFTKKRA